MSVWQERSYRKGRNDLPALLFDMYFGGELADKEVLASALEDAWTSAEFPERLVEQDVWVCMFEEVGYLDGSKPAVHPTERLTLYRGAPPEFKAHLAWTSDLDQALWFARRNEGWGLAADVWQADVHPNWLLAKFTDSRNENEYVINPVGIDIVPAITSSKRTTES